MIALLQRECGTPCSNRKDQDAFPADSKPEAVDKHVPSPQRWLGSSTRNTVSSVFVAAGVRRTPQLFMARSIEICYR